MQTRNATYDFIFDDDVFAERFVVGLGSRLPPEITATRSREEFVVRRARLKLALAAEKQHVSMRRLFVNAMNARIEAVPDLTARRKELGFRPRLPNETSIIAKKAPVPTVPVVATSPSYPRKKSPTQPASKEAHVTPSPLVIKKLPGQQPEAKRMIITKSPMKPGKAPPKVVSLRAATEGMPLKKGKAKKRALPKKVAS